MHEVDPVNARCIIITISDTRTIETDKSGKLIKELLHREEHNCIDHVIVKDEKLAISKQIDYAVSNKETDIILMTGGTGISNRDITIEVVEEKITKHLPGFGEVFRMLSYTEDIGSRAIMSRATAGRIGDKFIFAMPGSSGAVKLAMTKLILPEISHLLFELQKNK